MELSWKDARDSDWAFPSLSVQIGAYLHKVNVIMRPHIPIVGPGDKVCVGSLDPANRQKDSDQTVHKHTPSDTLKTADQCSHWQGWKKVDNGLGHDRSQIDRLDSRGQCGENSNSEP